MILRSRPNNLAAFRTRINHCPIFQIQFCSFALIETSSTSHVDLRFCFKIKEPRKRIADIFAPFICPLFKVHIFYNRKLIGMHADQHGTLNFYLYKIIFLVWSRKPKKSHWSLIERKFEIWFSVHEIVWLLVKTLDRTAVKRFGAGRDKASISPFPQCAQQARSSI